MAADRRYLKKHGNQWRVVLKVPDRLRAVVGKAHLVQPLHTDSLLVANRDKFRHVAAMKAALQDAERKQKLRAGRPDDPLTEEALTWRNAIADADLDPSFVTEDLDDGTVVPTGDTLVRSLLADRAEEIERREGYEAARQFHDTATGKATPLETLVEPWLAHKAMKPRQVLDYRRAVLKFIAWLKASKLSATAEGVTRKAAGRYITEAFVETGKNTRTANKDVSCLSQLWRWLESKGYAGENVWRSQSLPKARPKRGEDKRAFSDAEVLKLLTGAPNLLLKDFMLIAALTGMRVEEIARLNVRDVFRQADDIRFDIAEAKTAAGVRMVPVHPDLLAIVERRTAGKQARDALFPELPVPKEGSAMERSQKVVKAFTTYRRRVGVDDVPEGARQSRVDFHSFRRWFITKAEQAYQPPHFISSLVGHARSGMTLGRYSDGPLVRQYREVVEAVRLPHAVQAQE